MGHCGVCVGPTETREGGAGHRMAGLPRRVRQRGHLGTIQRRHPVPGCISREGEVAVTQRGSSILSSCCCEQLQLNGHSTGPGPSSPGPVFGVQAWGAAAWPGAVPPRVPGLVPARGQRGCSNDPLFPAGTQRAPVRLAGASGGAGGARQRGGPWHLPRSWGVPRAGCAGVLRLQNC